MIIPVIQHPDERLRQRADAVDFSDADEVQWMRATAQDLEDTLQGLEICIGLAAPQIGRSQRIIIVDVTRRGVDRYVMVNPVITKQSQQSQRVQDGCMSVQHGRFHSSTKRPLRIQVEWQDVAGVTHRQKFSNLMAACIHHEIDHLNGRLFIDPPGGQEASSG